MQKGQPSLDRHGGGGSTAKDPSVSNAYPVILGSSSRSIEKMTVATISGHEKLGLTAQRKSQAPSLTRVYLLNNDFAKSHNNQSSFMPREQFEENRLINGHRIPEDAIPASHHLLETLR